MTHLPAPVELLAVAAGGAVGAVTRFLCQTMLPMLSQHGAATMAVNIAGSLIIGVMWVVMRHFALSPLWSLFVITGILGGFTTYSSFSLDTIRMIEQGETVRAAIYAGGTLIFCLIACGTAFYITERLLK